MINVGIIGFGKMGRIRYETISQNGHGHVVAISDPQESANLPGVRRYVSADELIAAVFICTPNYLNKSLTIRALSAGKHVFCEKPPAFNAKEVEEVIEAER